MSRGSQQIARLFRHPLWVLIFAVSVLFLGGIGVVIRGESSVQAAAGVNQQFNYQGRLLTNAGATVPDGNYNMRFKIYQDGDGVAGGSDEVLKWTETRQNSAGQGVVVKNGYFSVYLGSVNPFGTSVNWDQDTLWLSMEVTTNGTDTGGSPTWNGEMSPFKRLGASPYALNTKYLGGLTASQFVQIAQGVQADASTASSIFLNKTGASGNILQFQKNGTDIMYVDNNGNLFTGGTVGIYNASAGAFVVATPTATSNPAFAVDTSTASAVTGVKITSKASGAGVNLAAISSATDEALSLDAKGAGALNLNSTGTGNILLGGGSSSTGCTVTNSTGAFACTGAITASNISGSNTGDVTLSGENYLSIVNQVITANAVNLSGTNVTGTLAAGRFPALTGDVTTSAGALSTTLATVNSNTGSFGSSTSIPTFTVNGKGLITAASGNAVIAPAGTLTGATLASGVTASSLTSLGTLSGLTVVGTANINATGSATTTIGALTSTDLVLRDANWNITGAGAATLASLSTAGQITSTVSTGTAPFVVASTTNIPNLNASLLGGATFASPGSIGSVTPGSGAFTTLTSTGITTLGNNSATVAVNSSDWDISTTGDVTGIGGLTMDGSFSQTGSGTFSTGTGAVTVNGALTVNSTASIQGHATVGSGSTVNGGLTRIDSLFGSTSHDTFLNIAETNTGTGTANVTYDGLLVNNTLNPSGSASYNQANGLYGLVTVAQGNSQNLTSTGGINGFNGGVVHAGTGTLSNTNGGLAATGVNGIVFNNGGGTIDIAAAVSATIINYNNLGVGGGGIIGSARAINIASPLVFSGSITNNYGLYINDQSGAGSSASYNLFSGGSGSKNLFEGQVGIGTIPARILDISGNSSTSDYIMRITDTDTGGGAQGLLIRLGQDSYSTASTYIAFRTPGGNSAGSIQQSGSTAVSYVATSDGRLKENIIDSQRGLDVINRIQVRDYSFITDDTHTIQQGMIAQELYEVYGQAVAVGGDNAQENPWGIDYGKLTPLLIKGLQDLDDKHEKLQADFSDHIAGLETSSSNQGEQNGAVITSLTADMQALSDRITALENQAPQLGEGFANGGIVTGDAEFKAGVIFAAKTNFKGEVNIEGDLILNDSLRGIDVSVDVAATTKQVTFATSKVDTKYAIQCTPTWGTSCYVTNKTKDGFTLNFTLPAPANASVDWTLMR